MPDPFGGRHDAAVAPAHHRTRPDRRALHGAGGRTARQRLIRSGQMARHGLDDPPHVVGGHVQVRHQPRRPAVHGAHLDTVLGQRGPYWCPGSRP
ncbi:hypothetical protein G6F68_019821 [Rhizopus microsporus]|nr:hypothetical protein G6F68_019821 [Rhizopus microsporus]